MKGEYLAVIHNEQEWQHADQAIEWIHSLLTLGLKPGLKRMEWMLERLNHPHRRLKFIHVGGTNGKGSTVAFLRHVLQEAGFEVGTFTSPYIERFHNRVQLNGQDIADEDFLALAKIVKPLADELATTELDTPTEFEVVTTIAILYFATVVYPDIVLWEVGLGGRLDSTNVVAPILSIITNVGHDHMHILGEKLEDIAFEKAGIIKSGVHTVTAIHQEEALAVVKEKAKEKQANLYIANRDYNVEIGTSTLREQTFTFQSMFATYENLKITMQGKHQIQNASVAVMALEVLKQFYALIWDEEHLRAGLEKAAWIGRLETLIENPLTIIDGAHNPEGIAALAQFLEEHYQNKKITLFFSAMKDKKIAEMLSTLQGKVDRLIVTQFDFPRVASADELLEQVQESSLNDKMDISAEADWHEAYQHLVQLETEDEVILFTGSLYFISAVRERLKER